MLFVQNNVFHCNFFKRVFIVLQTFSLLNYSYYKANYSLDAFAQEDRSLELAMSNAVLNRSDKSEKGEHGH